MFRLKVPTVNLVKAGTQDLSSPKYCVVQHPLNLYGDNVTLSFLFSSDEIRLDKPSCGKQCTGIDADPAPVSESHCPQISLVFTDFLGGV